MDSIDFLAFTPLGGAGIALPLVQFLSILDHAIVTTTSRELAQEIDELPVAHTRVDGLRRAFSEGATLLNRRVIGPCDHGQPGEQGRPGDPGDQGPAKV